MENADGLSLRRIPWMIKVLLFVGGGLFALATILIVLRWQFLASAQHEMAIVSAVNREAMDDQGDGYRISATFRDRGQGMVTVRSSVVSSSNSWRVGDAVAVDYPVGQPEKAVIATFVDRWLGPLVVGGIGFVFLVIGGAGFWMAHQPGTRIHKVGNNVVGMSWNAPTATDDPPEPRA